MVTSSKAAKLRALLASNDPVIVAGAHNGLSGRLVQEAGFDAVWASGFEVSASFALPDADLLTRSEYLMAARAIDDACTLPVIADCDAGFGNAVNVMRTVHEYERAGIAGICVEDNAFPKRCSFYDSAARRLEPPRVFADKVRAAKAAQQTAEFVFIARTEALVASMGVEEALLRARLYADAGADLCLIHSKSSKADEVMAVSAAWDRDTPLVCVPTTYASTTATSLVEAGYKVVIFANHGIRGAISGMRVALAAVRRGGFAGAADEAIVGLDEVYGLVDVAGLRRAEGQFLATATNGEAESTDG